MTGHELLQRWIQIAAIPDEDWITRQLALGPILREYATEKQAGMQREMQGCINAAMPGQAQLLQQYQGQMQAQLIAQYQQLEMRSRGIYLVASSSIGIGC